MVIKLATAAVASLTLLGTVVSSPSAHAETRCAAPAPLDVLRIGVRSDAAPFSSLRSQDGVTDGAPARFGGYSVRLCARFAETRLRRTACFEPVTAQNRFDALRLPRSAPGSVDMLCGATTATLEVQRMFPTSLYTFLTASTMLYDPARLAKAQAAGVVRYGVLRGTTVDIPPDDWRSLPDALARRLDGARSEPSHLLSHDDAVAALTRDADPLDVYIADRPILTALRSSPALSPSFVVDDASLTVQPYSVVFRNDDVFPESEIATGADLAFWFNTYLVTEFFKPDRLPAFRNLLQTTFGSDVDVAFLTLARIQGAIPKGGSLTQQ